MASYKFDGSKLKMGSKVVANVRGDKIYEGSYAARKMGTLKDAQSGIDGPGGTTIAALWVLCVK